MYRAMIMAFCYLWAAVVGTAAPIALSDPLSACVGECRSAHSNDSESDSESWASCCAVSEETNSQPPCCDDAAPGLPDRGLTALVSATQPAYVVVAVMPDEQLGISFLGFSETNLAHLPSRCEPPPGKALLISQQVWRL
jgi:hypothetical protein